MSRLAQNFESRGQHCERDEAQTKCLCLSRPQKKRYLGRLRAEDEHLYCVANSYGVFRRGRLQVVAQYDLWAGTLKKQVYKMG